MIAGRYRYVAIEGPIGAGKTSLAQKLARHYGAQTLLEKPEANPFLERFYADRARYALPTQLYFLFQRVQQLAELRQLDLFRDLLFARFPARQGSAVCAPDACRRRTAAVRADPRATRPQAPAPDLVICLQAAPATLAERVLRRGNPVEARVSEEYLRRWRKGMQAFSTIMMPRRCSS